MYQDIINLINTYITANGGGAITGSKLNQVLNALANYYGFDGVTVATLPAGSQATATVTNRTLNLGIPAGQNGEDATNPFKGWWMDFDDLKAAFTATEGDSAYVYNGAGWDIYVYDSTASTDNYWADSGTDADTTGAQTFASGQQVNQVHIVDNLEGTSANDVLSAKQGKQLNERLFGYYDESEGEAVTTTPFTQSGSLVAVMFQNSETQAWIKGGNQRSARLGSANLAAIRAAGYTKLKITMNLYVSGVHADGKLTFIKKEPPTATTSFADLVSGGYLSSVHSDYSHVIIPCPSSSNEEKTTIVPIPDDAWDVIFVAKDNSSTQPSDYRIPKTIVPYSKFFNGDIQDIEEDIEELQQGPQSINGSIIVNESITKDKFAENAVDDALVGEVDEYMSFNLLDYSSLVTGTYLDNGVVKTGVSSSYAATNRIALKGKKVWWGGSYTFGNYGATNGAAVFDVQGNLIRAFKPTNFAIESYDPTTSGDEGAAYIQLTMVSQTSTVSYVVYAKEDGTNPMADWASATTNQIDDLYRKQIVKHSNQSAVLAKENLPELIPAYSMCGQDGAKRKEVSISAGGYPYIEGTYYPSYINCCHTISFKGSFSSFGSSDTIKFGINRNNAAGKIVCITSTDVKIQRYDNGYVDNVAYSHGLTLADFIMVEVSFTWKGGKMRIVTNGGSYVKEWSITEYVSGGQEGSQINYGRAFMETSVAMTNVTLTQTSDKFKCPVWVFGDSFVSMYEARWTYQMVNIFGIDSFLLDGFPGAKSANIYPDLVKALNYGTPKYLLWCLGENDNPVLWKYYETSIEQICRDRGITLILMTVPRRDDDNVTAPPIYQEKITQYVLDSGYRYFDERAAVSADENGNWYSGMRSSDNCHPTVLGAKAMAGQLLVDFPEIANYK